MSVVAAWSSCGDSIRTEDRCPTPRPFHPTFATSQRRSPIPVRCGAVHAATDASVVLHELAHLVLCHGVGGRDDDSPFETSGESAAVGEGLADALALTMWNARLRAMSAPEVMSIGEWVLRHRHRDYAAYLPSNGRWSGSDKYKRGQALCAALLEFRSGTGLSPDAADEELWRTVCGALHGLPHQLDQPKGCCISETLLREASAAHRGALDAALRKRGVSAGKCPHIKKI